METNCKIIRNTFDRTGHKDILDAKLGLREMSIKIIEGHLNDKSIENKFDALTFIIDPNIGMLLI